MALLEIATQTGPEAGPQVISCVLNGSLYQLYLRYNERAGMWRLDLKDDTGNALASGLSLRNMGIPANGCLLLQQGLPPGLLGAVAQASPGIDANAEELGARVKLMYLEAVSGV